MDELLDEIQTFLNQKAAASTDSNIEVHHELSCELCIEDGFDECQGHAYDVDNDVYLD